MNNQPEIAESPAAASEWARVEQALDTWLDQLDLSGLTPAAAPRHLLEEACGGDLDLMSQVEELAARLGDQDDRLDVEVHNALPDLIDELQTTIDEEPHRGLIGKSIDRYRVVSVLGTGGMGVVYEAERADAHFDKKVALKLLPRGLETSERERRFRTERQILARLEHPNIARLIDGGVTSEGFPYLVMELVPGEPIDAYCASGGLDERERIELLLQVCSAVHFAHQNLVLHRDLKPSNFLVVDLGESAAGTASVKLLDFGIGKLLDESTDDTLTRVQPMTPQYAAPEQLRNDTVSTATDIYALGILLRQLVVEPLTRRGSAGDLGVILERAMHDLPERRFASAAEMADDLRRYLDGRAIESRASTWGYRLMKTVRRNRGVTAGVGIAVLSLLIGTVVSVRQARVVAAERDQARREARRTQQVTELLTGLFQNADPYSLGGGQLTASELLDRGEVRIATELSDQPEIRGAVLSAMGSARAGLGQAERGRELLQRAEEDIRSARPPDESALASVLRELATVELDLGEVDAAVRRLAEAVRLLDRSSAGDVPEWPRIERQLGRIASIQGNYVKAASHHRRALELFEARGLIREAAVEKTWLATNLEQEGLVADGVRLEQEAMAVLRESYGEDHPNVAALRNNVAVSLTQLGRLPEAEELYREALRSAERTFGPSHLALATTLTNLGRVLMDMGRFEEAGDPLRRALALHRAGSPEGDFSRIGSEINLATLESALGNFEEATTRYRAMARRLARSTGPQSPASGRVQTLLGIALHRNGDLDQAELLLRDALEIDFRNDLREADALAALGAVLRDRGLAVQAEPLLRRALELRSRVSGEHDWKMVEVRIELAGSLLQLPEPSPTHRAEAADLLRATRHLPLTQPGQEWLGERRRKLNAAAESSRGQLPGSSSLP